MRRFGESLAACAITTLAVTVAGFLATRFAFLFRSVDRDSLLLTYHRSIGVVALASFLANLVGGDPVNAFLRSATFWSLVVTLPLGLIALFTWAFRKVSSTR